MFEDFEVTFTGRRKEYIEKAAADVGVSYQHFVNRLINMYDANFAEDVEWMKEMFEEDSEDEKAIVEETRPEEEK